MMRMIWIVGLLLVLLAGCQRQDETVPLLAAHAHNDYQHDRPLYDALAHGFTSVEADVFLVGDELRVGHEPDELMPDQTLQSLYLEPLRARVKAHGGHVYREGTRFILLVDLKTAAEPTYRRLHDILTGYRDILVGLGPQDHKKGAVLVIVSGNRPLELMQAQPVRYAGYDGRLTDLNSPASADVIPLISDQWSRHFTWRGEGPMPAEEQRRLRDIVQKAHGQDRLVRFWATPDAASPAREALWQELRAAGVDLLNTDDLKGLQEFLLRHGR